METVPPRVETSPSPLVSKLIPMPNVGTSLGMYCVSHPGRTSGSALLPSCCDLQCDPECEVVQGGHFLVLMLICILTPCRHSVDIWVTDAYNFVRPCKRARKVWREHPSQKLQTSWTGMPLSQSPITFTNVVCCSVVWRINQRMIEWASWDRLRSFLQREDIKDGVDRLNRELDYWVMKFNVCFIYAIAFLD